MCWRARPPLSLSAGFCRPLPGVCGLASGKGNCSENFNKDQVSCFSVPADNSTKFMHELHSYIFFPIFFKVGRIFHLSLVCVCVFLATLCRLSMNICPSPRRHISAGTWLSVICQTRAIQETSLMSNTKGLTYLFEIGPPVMRPQCNTRTKIQLWLPDVQQVFADQTRYLLPALN